MNTDVVVVLREFLDEYSLYHLVGILDRFRFNIEILSKKFYIYRIYGDDFAIKKLLRNLGNKIVFTFRNFEISHCIDVYKLP